MCIGRALINMDNMDLEEFDEKCLNSGLDMSEHISDVEIDTFESISQEKKQSPFALQFYLFSV